MNDELSRAVSRGDIAKMKELLKRGADKNKKGKYGDTPLMISVIHRKYEIANFLIRNGADLNIKNDSGYTALITAVSTGDPGFAELLLKAGALVDARNHDGDTAIMFVGSGLLSYKRRIENDAAFRNGMYDILKKRKITTGEMILDNTKRLVNILVSFGADINAKSDNGTTALMRAASSEDCNPALISYMVEKGAKINIRNVKGQTPLTYAVSSGSIACAKVLIKKGADVHVVDKDNKFLVDIAEERIDKPMVDLLRRANAY